MRRFEVRWERWDAAVAAGERPMDFLPRLSDEALVQLLAGSAQRRYERDLVATELLNRLARLRRALGEIAEAADHHIDAAIHEAEVASEAIDRTIGAVTTHIEARRDSIADEPRTARVAGAATERVREALDQADGTRQRLRALADDADPEASEG